MVITFHLRKGVKWHSGANAKLVTYERGEYRKRAQNGEFVTAQARLDGRQWRAGQLLLSARLLGGA